MDIDISVMHPSELSGAQIEAWHVMQDQTPSLANPFLCPEFAQAVGRYNSAARVAVISDRGCLAGFFPFERRRLGVGMPIGAGLSDCQGLVRTPGGPWDPAELLRGCGLSVWHFDHLVSSQQPFAGDQVAAAASPVIDLADGFATYLDRHRPAAARFWRNLERQVRKIERDVGKLKLGAESADTGDLQRMISWKSAQYRRTGRGDLFAQPWMTEMLEHLLTYRNGAFRGVLSVLYAGGSPVAGNFGLLHGGVFAGWFTAYDASFRSYSPGLIQMVRMAEELADAGVRMIDMGKGEKWYKNKLKSYDLVVGEGTATSRSALAAVHRTRLAVPSWAERQIRAHPALFTAADRMLKAYGRIHVALSRRPDRSP